MRTRDEDLYLAGVETGAVWATEIARPEQLLNPLPHRSAEFQRGFADGVRRMIEGILEELEFEESRLSPHPRALAAGSEVSPCTLD